MAIACPTALVVRTMLLSAETGGRLAGTVKDAAEILDVWTTLPHAPLAIFIDEEGLAMPMDA
jgi:hypothetical protein